MSRTPFNAIAHLRAKPGLEQALEDAIMACVAPTRAEEGNVNYDLHRSQDDPAVFAIYEGWKSREALETHLQTPHIEALMATLEELVAERPDGKPFTLMATLEELVAERGSDGKPFTLELLVMVSDVASPKL